MKRILTIIIILLVIVLLILGGAWMMSRKKAKENNAPLPTFRQFLGIGATGTEPVAPGSSDGEFSSDFIPGEQPTDSSTVPGQGTSGGAVAVSQFTSGPLTPAENNTGTSQSGGNNQGSLNTGGGSSSSSGGSGSGSGTGTGGGSGGSGTGGGSGSGGVGITGPICEDRGLNISFTQEEIARLNTLQNRFYDVAANLRTDGDIQIEIANYDSFKAKADEALDLYNYCVVQAPRIAAPIYKSRIVTPFWFEPGMDKQGYATNRQFEASIDPSNVERTKANMEHLFRINLW